MSKTTFVVEPGTQQVVMTREFDAPRELVWRAMTDRDLIPEWWGPSYLTTEVAAMDVRPGGEWRYVQRDPDGQAFAFHGFYHEITEPSQVVSTFEFDGLPERHVVMETLRLTERDGRTVATQTSVFQSVADRDGMIASGMQGGATEAMDQLAAVVEKLRAGAPLTGA